MATHGQTERPGSGPHLRVAWFGHAVGRRSDGLTTYSSQVVSGLVDRGCEVYFHHASADGDWVPVDQRHNFSWWTRRFKTVTVLAPGERRRISAWLHQQRPDVLHCSLSFTLSDGWLGREARRVGACAVCTFHLPFGRPGSRREMVMHQLHRYWAPRLREYDRVIVFSEDHRRRLSEIGLDPGRIEVVPNAVDTNQFSPGPSRLRRDRLPSKRLVVGYMGRLDPEKGISELLRGFTEAASEDCSLLLAGGGSLRRSVEAAARSDPRIVYLGQLTTLRERLDFWRALDVFCLPSSAEGLSLSLLEAMACGRALAATPAGGWDAAPEVIAKLAPQDLGQSLAELIQSLTAEPERARQLGRLARLEAVRHYGVEAMLDRLLGIYHACLSSPATVAGGLEP